MKTVRRSNRQRRVMREPDSVYFDELQMSILNLGFELSAAEKDLLRIPIEEDCTQQKGNTCQKGLKLKRGRNTKRANRPSKKEIEILVSALESIEEEQIHKKRVTEEETEVRYSHESKAVNQVDLNTEDSSSDGDLSLIHI